MGPQLRFLNSRYVPRSSQEAGSLIHQSPRDSLRTSLVSYGEPIHVLHRQGTTDPTPERRGSMRALPVAQETPPYADAYHYWQQQQQQQRRRQPPTAEDPATPPWTIAAATTIPAVGEDFNNNTPKDALPASRP